MLTSIATVSLSGTLEGKLRAAAQARFDGVEIFESDLLTARSTAREIALLLRDLGLRCTMFQPFRDFEGMPDAIRVRTLERLERKFDLMQELETDLLLVCSNVSPASSSERGRMVADLRELAERAGRRGLRVGYEALAWGRHVFDHRDAWSLVQEVNHPALGLILDSFHSLARGIPVESLRDLDPARIFTVQLADAPLAQMDFLSWSRHFRNLPGQGELPVVEFVTALLERGYDGPLSLEIFNDQFRSTSTSSVALDGHRSLSFLLDQVARITARVPDLPPRIASGRIAFIEFAANEEESGELEGLFTALGFAKAGRHRSKNVTRWSQNAINFVINGEPESFARTYDSLHGASVCAIGVSVPDVAAGLRRAEGLQIERFSQPIGPGELVIPSILGVGGSLVYFMQTQCERAIWESEFIEAQPDAPAPHAGVEAIDHIAQTLPQEEMLSWILYYISLFDVAKTPLVEIADPLGLVQTRAIESADGGLRITLNASIGPRTLSARFVQGYHGAGLQHIALGTRDILASARRLRSLGLPVLPIPHNYYEDLQARFGLEAALIDQLAEFNILYDRDPSGEYFQLVSRAFSKRFFFEIVERRGYRGYGIANAPIRLAAQSRYRDDLEN